MNKILVIDDEPTTLEDIQDILELEDYDVITTTSGEEGIVLANEHRPDLIISDILMPSVDGFELVDTLKSNQNLSSTPILFLTGVSEWDYLRRGMSLGIDDYMLKPFTSTQLIERVKLQLKKRRDIRNELRKEVWTHHKNLIHTLPAEINGSLMGIIGYGDLIQARNGMVPPTELIEYANSIVRSGERMYRSLSNLLLFAQLELIKDDEKARPDVGNQRCLYPGRITNSTAFHISENYHRENDLELDTCDVPVKINDEELYRIVYEIVDNAFKFTRYGQKVTVQTRSVEGCFELVVRDQGPGLTREDRLFVTMPQSIHAQMANPQGSGLGLILATRLAEVYGGQVAFANTEEGLAVRVRLSLGYDT